MFYAVMSTIIVAGINYAIYKECQYIYRKFLKQFPECR